MATFQRRPETIGAKFFNGNNAQEIADFLSADSNHKWSAEDVVTVSPINYWALKNATEHWWMADDEFRLTYRLTVQGKDESIPDEYR